MARVIALVGRPNVGKSTLFNRLTRSRDALVADFPGLTRDRQYGLARLDDGPCIVIDTGGLSGEEAGIDEAMAKQTLAAVEEADLVLLMVDARSGISAGDTLIADRLRRMGRDALLVLNKVDGVGDEAALAEFSELGFSDVFPASAAHGRGMRQLMETIGERLPLEDAGPMRHSSAVLPLVLSGDRTSANPPWSIAFSARTGLSSTTRPERRETRSTFPTIGTVSPTR